MAELADAPDLGSGVNDVQVQVLLSAEKKERHTGYGSYPVCRSFFSVYEHHEECREKQCGAYKYSFCPEKLDHKVADNRADDKTQDHPVVENRVSECGGFLSVKIMVQVFRAAPQVSDAHGGGDAVAVYLAETFDLNTAGKGCKRIGGKIQTQGKEADSDEDKSF